MRYRIRQKIFSIGDKFTIRDEMDTDCYFVRGKVFSFGNKLYLEDMMGNELIYIEQKIFRFLPEYNLFKDGQQIAHVKKQFTFFKQKFNITSDYGNFEIDGDVFTHEFSILKNGSPVCEISKKWFSFTDSYGVDINDNEDIPFMLALTIVIDQVLHDNQGSRSSSGSH